MARIYVTVAEKEAGRGVFRKIGRLQRGLRPRVMPSPEALEEMPP